MSTFITRLDEGGDGPRLAVKDIIDVAGVPTTCGCRAIEQTAEPAASDAACLAGARAAGARIVGKANLHELAMLPIGSNPWFGTPVNPLDPDLIPGGSSSGSAVAVATGDADVALGSDTGGSVRVPSACCGTAGLKTTYGRIPVDGVWPLAPSLDTIGPMARDIAGVTLGMQLLEPGFTAADATARVVGRVRTSGVPEIEDAIDAALRAAELEVVSVDWADLVPGVDNFAPFYFAEIWDVDHELVEQHPDGVGADLIEWMAVADAFRPGGEEARVAIEAWKQSVAALFERVELLALPTLPVFPPRLDAVTSETLIGTIIEITTNVALFNAAGVPCSAQPVAVAGSHLPASLQLVGPHHSEERILATAAHVEAALA
jgi:amidase